jgi:hypothetical protein
MMQGMMFLPDGRMLIMDKEQYKKVIEQSIVLDLVETDNEQNPGQDQQQDASENNLEEEKSTGMATRMVKDSNRK